MNKIITSILFLSVISTSAFSQANQQYDQKGRLIMQQNEDGSISTYSYNKPGNRTVSTSSKEQEIHFDKEGTTAVKSKKKAH